MAYCSPRALKAKNNQSEQYNQTDENAQCTIFKIYRVNERSRMVHKMVYLSYFVVPPNKIRYTLWIFKP